MIERLRHALEHLDELPREVQEDIAQYIEKQAAGALSSPERIRVALAAIGDASDLQYDDEFTALERIGGK